ncbi:uncharacterized protein LOC119603145 [Lucilia sericata]|uniref:uncharacterized protein LOC119603145 n=1 Tax=Lucilia sericata TaxID=13632 RepID=UPI0018A87BDD|nr:uncharacterized protein LOC119603145 [Lucilia sericata]
MASSSKKNKVDRRHRKEWENEIWAKGWLKSIADAPLSYQSTSNDQYTSWCFGCKIVLRSHKIDLKKHSESNKHISNMAVLFKQNKIENFIIQPQSNESKIIDIKLAVFIAKHSSIVSVDHLTTLLRNCSTKESAFEKLRLHKTKCTAIIKNVVSPSILEDLVKDIGDNFYSLVVDESTDISQTKWMSICVEEATATHLFEGMKLFLNKVGLNIKNLITLGTDGASNLFGKNKSLFILLKQENPQLLLLKCTCHSLHLCCSKASSEIPKNADFLLKEIYNYFSHSPLRTLLYKRAFDLVNIGVDSNNFRKLVQISGTRWLSYGAAIRRVLEQWVELKYHFSLISTAENDKTAQHIYKELSDEKIDFF